MPIQLFKLAIMKNNMNIINWYFITILLFKIKKRFDTGDATGSKRDHNRSILPDRSKGRGVQMYIFLLTYTFELLYLLIFFMYKISQNGFFKANRYHSSPLTYKLKGRYTGEDLNDIA